jgi:methylmalonyl-CoA mutase cobalamin-binding subunit
MTKELENSLSEFRQAVGDSARQWQAEGLPSRQVLEETAVKWVCLRNRLKIQGIFLQPPCMVTATLDDGLGQGMGIIEKYAAAIGMRLISLGLMVSPPVIVDACRRHRPEFLGMTILQFDSEEDLRSISENLPGNTRIIAGGPVFRADPAFAARTGTHYAARNVADFLRFMLDRACGG